MTMEFLPDLDGDVGHAFDDDVIGVGGRSHWKWTTSEWLASNSSVTSSVTLSERVLSTSLASLAVDFEVAVTLDFLHVVDIDDFVALVFDVFERVAFNDQVPIARVDVLRSGRF